MKDKNTKQSQVLVAHTCNPSDLGGRDQEDCPIQSQPWQDLILKIPNTKQRWQSGSTGTVPT
jgi:hypothetical protein